MKAIAFQNRLVRDLDVTSVVDLTADIRQEILDAINSAIQTLYALDDPDSKTTRGAIYIEAPQTLTLNVVQGSSEIGGHLFQTSEFYRTIRIDGDIIDNQVNGNDTLLHPYTGTTGTVNATLYCDAIHLAEPYAEVISTELVVMEDQSEIKSAEFRLSNLRTRRLGRPRYFKTESNARVQNPPAPALIRFDTLPTSAWRIEGDFSLAPARIALGDLLSPGAIIPFREQHIESYLLPIARALMTDSRSWRDIKTKQSVKDAAAAAETKYGLLAQKTLRTPRNKVRTAPGY